VDIKGLKISALLFFLCSSTPLLAESWSLGSVVGQGSGLSVQYRSDTDSGLHMVGRLYDGDQLALEAVQQHFTRSDLIFKNTLELYSGLGLSGEADRNSKNYESYHLVLQLGAQWSLRSVPVQFFVDQSLLTGPLPYTDVLGRLQGGFRGVF